MIQPESPDIDRLLRVLALLTPLFYLAPRVFSPLAPASRLWLRRASMATLALGVLIALAASLLWLLN